MTPALPTTTSRRISPLSFPASLGAAQSLRDSKREQLAALFLQVQAIQRNMKGMEEELMELDEHIDGLEEQQQKQQQQQDAAAASRIATRVKQHAHVHEEEQADTFTQADILTDPATQLTQFVSPAAALPRQQPSGTAAAAAKPTPLLLSEIEAPPRRKRPSFASSSTTAPLDSSRTFPVAPPPPSWRPQVRRLLRDTFRLPSFRHQQEAIIDATIGGHDVFCVMRTGGGKSLTYQLPALMNDNDNSQITLVVSPLISLIHDQETQFNTIAGRSTAALSLTSGIGVTEHARRWDLIRDPSAGVRLLLVTPEKVHKSTKLRNELQKLYDSNRLGRFVIDEAHCASQWGISFRPDYAQLGILKRHFPTVPLIAVTATASERVRADVCAILGLQAASTRMFRSTANRPNLRYAICPKADTKDAIVADMTAWIQTHWPTDAGIIYTLSRKEAETVAAGLRAHGIPADAYHSDVAAGRKQRIHQQWMDNHLQVVVATIAFGLGINKPNVRFVLHHCISKNVDSYYQESGRAGRDGDPADCVLYYSPKDVPRMRGMVHDTPGGAENLMPMVRYAQAFGNDAVCRAILLDSLGEPDAPSPPDVLQEHGTATTQARDVGLHGQTATRLLYHHVQRGDDLTLTMLVKAWRTKNDVPEFVQTNPPTDVSVTECEQIIIALLLEGIIDFHVHWTAYKAVAYLRLGPRGEALLQSMNPRMIVRFPLTNAAKPKAKVARAVASSDSSGWLTARKPAKKRKSTALTKKKAVPKKAAAAKKKPAPKKAATAKVTKARKPHAAKSTTVPPKMASKSILESLGGRPGQQVIELSSDDEDSDDGEFEFE